MTWPSGGLNTTATQSTVYSVICTHPPRVSEVLINDELLGFHLEDGRFISVPIGFYPTVALATPEEQNRFEINGSSVYWPDLDADIGAEGLLAGAREHHYYARRAVERAVRLGRLPKSALEEAATTPARSNPSPPAIAPSQA